jgi:RNA-directed DNA polymerase
MRLFERVRSRAVLHHAWAKVKAGGFSSTSENTQAAIRKFEIHWLSSLERVSRHLRDGTFAFTGDRGVALPKGKGKIGLRPLVIGSVESRIVRRGILDVLQGYGERELSPRRRWEGVPTIRSITEIPTSVGGISGKGVPHGLALIDRAVREGKSWFIRSDIKNFFTRIPKREVSNVVREAVNDEDFSDLFEEALSTNLVNQEELEERHLFKLFPDEHVGVAQGSALSALAGNIALREFDNDLNCRGIVCVRYIDDFILLGPTEAKVFRAYQSAREFLSTLGMDAYELDDSSAKAAGKFDSGNIHTGTDMLGYRISGRSRQPCNAARQKFLEKLDSVVAKAVQEMQQAARGNSRAYHWRYHQALAFMNNLVWGWSQSFRHTTALHVFESLDKEIDRRIERLQTEARRLTFGGNPALRRRVLGVHLLTDTALCDLPEEVVSKASASSKLGISASMDFLNSRHA